LDAQLSLAKIDVTPFQRGDLAAPKARFPTEQDDHFAWLPKLTTCGHEALVVRKVVEAR
jgi:hypothetical protein